MCALMYREKKGNAEMYMSKKLREDLADVMGKMKVVILCVQETRLKAKPGILEVESSCSAMALDGKEL